MTSWRVGDGTAGAEYRLVVNAGTRDQDLAWMAQVAESFAVELRERADLVMLAVQMVMEGVRAFLASSGS